MRRFGMAIALAVMALTGGPGGMASAADPAPAWGVSERATGGQFLWGTDLAVDRGGHVHVVEAGLHNGKAGVFYTTDRSGSWVTRRILAWGPDTTWIRPSLALDNNDRIHLAIDRVECVECSVARTLGVFYLTDKGRTRGTFGEPVRLTPNGTSQGSLRVAGGHVFLAFAGGWGDTLTKVRLLTDASGRWTTTQIAAAGARPFLRLSMTGLPRVVFEAGSRLRYARASSVTGGWTVEPITGTDGADDHPVLSIDETGGVHTAWLDTSGATWVARYAHRTGAGWTAGLSLGDAQQVALSVDKPDTIWLVTGGDAVDTAVGDGSQFAVHQLAGASQDVAIKVLDSGAVVAAWVADGGLWVAWN